MNIPSLSPYAFHIGPLGIHWYSIFMALSMLLGALYLVREGERRGMNPDRLMDLALWVLIGGIVGARVVFVFANDPQWIWKDPLQVFRVWQGGLAWDGGLLGGILAGLPVLRKTGYRFNQIADLAVPGLSLGYILVRVGNIFNHEVLGRHTAFWFGRWPAQPIGSTIGIILLLRYFYLERRYGDRMVSGYQFWTFSFWYQVLRGFVEESVRTNPLYLIHYISPTWGVGFTTLEQLFTPPILIFSWWMLRVAQKQKVPRRVSRQPA